MSRFLHSAAPGVLIATILCSIALGSGMLASGAKPPSFVQGAAGSVSPVELPEAPSLADSNPWTPATAYPTAIARYAFAQVGQDSYVISGIVLGADVVSTVRRYNSTTNVWTTLANIPVGSEAPVGAFFNGKIYVADGGNDGPILRIYDIATNTWSAGPARPVPTSSYGGAAGAFNGNFYVVGGGFPPTQHSQSTTSRATPGAPVRLRPHLSYSEVILR